jgi:hypothetical protein
VATRDSRVTEPARGALTRRIRRVTERNDESAPAPALGRGSTQLAPSNGLTSKKYAEDFNAIHEAANDGNAATTPDADWQPFLATPAYPDQPSGHVSLTTAITMTAQRFFDPDKLSFHATSQVVYVPGTLTLNTDPTVTATRSFTTLSQARDEVVEARILQGIHFRLADEGGVEIGKGVTNYVNSHLLKTVDG